MIPPSARLDNSALLVIDVINSCAHETCERPELGIAFSRIRAMVPSLSAFMRVYSQLGGSVIAVTSVPWQEAYLPENINELYRNDASARYWSQEAGFGEQFYVLPPEGALTITKNTYDAFASASLVNTLEEQGKKYIIVAGVFGDGCVMASICGGFSKGYHFIIAADLIETTDDECRQATLKGLKGHTWPKMYGATVGWRDILSAFS